MTIILSWMTLFFAKTIIRHDPFGPPSILGIIRYMKITSPGKFCEENKNFDYIKQLLGKQ